MIELEKIINFSDSLLKLSSYEDYGPMGLQYYGKEQVNKIGTAVSIGGGVIEEAIKARVDLLFVHHGLFWFNEERVFDPRMTKRIKLLQNFDISVAAYHLALDAHPKIGNNALLAASIGVNITDSFANIGVGGFLNKNTLVSDVSSILHAKLGTPPLTYAFGKNKINRVAVITGKAGSYITQAAKENYDLFITGEAEEPTLYLAKDLGINFIAAGHDRSERAGVVKLGEIVSHEFDLDCHNINVYNPV